MDEERRRLLAAGLLAPWVLASGCSAPPPLTRVGGIVWVGYQPLFLARELGLLDPALLRLVEMPSNTDNLMALATADVEAATLTLDECLLAREGGLDVRAILVFDESAGADVVMSRPEIQRLDELRGKRVGVESTAAGALMLSKLLELAELAPEEVVVVELTSTRHVQAYLADEVDALVSWEPLATQLEAKGARRLLDSSRLPGLIVDLLAAHADALARSPESFRQLLAGYFKALEHLRVAPDDAYRRMAPRLGLTPQEVREAFRGVHFLDRAANRAWLGGPSPALLPAAQTVARIMKSNVLLQRIPALDGLADPQFLPREA